jgi:hypothetical protein
MKIFVYIASAVLTLASSSVGAATVWLPTSGDTDFIQLDIGQGQGGISTNGGSLALFDDTDDMTSSNALVIGDSGGQVFFTDLGGDWRAQINGSSIVLEENNWFKLGITWDGTTYYGDSDASLVGDDSWLIVFAEQGPGPGPGRRGNTLAVDLAPIPVPAAVWLFGTGLLGLVGVARRRA